MNRRPEATGQPPPAQHYDFSRLGRHRLRAPNGAVIDLPVPIVPGARVWVATIWPDPNAPGGWARQVWALDTATGRGWQLPLQLAAGDVLEFGADTPAAPVRWYGIMDSYAVNEWATMQGPYEHPAAAHEQAQRLLALERFVEPLSAEPPTPAVNPDPLRRPRREHRHRRRPSQQRGGSSPI